MITWAVRPDIWLGPFLWLSDDSVTVGTRILVTSHHLHYAPFDLVFLLSPPSSIRFPPGKETHPQSVESLVATAFTAIIDLPTHLFVYLYLSNHFPSCNHVESSRTINLPSPLLDSCQTPIVLLSLTLPSPHYPPPLLPSSSFRDRPTSTAQRHLHSVGSLAHGFCSLLGASFKRLAVRSTFHSRPLLATPLRCTLVVCSP